jgi:hypothetical protein
MVIDVADAAELENVIRTLSRMPDVLLVTRVGLAKKAGGDG